MSNSLQLFSEPEKIIASPTYVYEREIKAGDIQEPERDYLTAWEFGRMPGDYEIGTQTR